ncbi:MAG: hypothetical protein [Bacteriophage sp.]|nr:MAG: hypothetical protein [Bacteriophage sp.]
MSIPVSILSQLNELEADHDGSIKNVPEDNPKLKKLRLFFNPSENPIKKENEIKQLILDGYSRQEVVDRLSVSKDTIRNVIDKYDLEVRPLLTYVAVKENSPRIYSHNYQNYYQVISGHPWKLDLVRKALAKKGYRLIKLHNPSHWKNLMPGDMYLERKGFCVKQ